MIDNPYVHGAIKHLASELWLAPTRAVPRPGLDARPWCSAFTTFRVDEDGETWHLARRAESDELFDRLLS